MTPIHSKSRQQAEIAFGSIQSQFFAQDHAVEEMDYVAQVREAKTLRLREARMAKEARDLANLSELPKTKRIKKAPSSS